MSGSSGFISRRQLLRTIGLGSIAACTLTTRATESVRSPDDFINTDTQAAIDEGLDYLAQHQSSKGAFFDRTNIGNVAITALAGLAFLSAGHQPSRGKYGKVVSKATDYILSMGKSSSRSGYLQNADLYQQHSSMYQHGFGSLFLSEVHGTFPDPSRQADVRSMLEKAIQLTVKSQNKDGGWRYEPMPSNADVSVTVAQLMALRAAKNAGIYVDKSVVDKCVEYIKGCQLDDGGFCYMKGQKQTGSLFPRSAASIVGLYSAGIYEGEQIEKGLKYLMKFIPSGRRQMVEFRQDHFFYGHYYAALAMWTAGGTYWAEWFPAIRDELLSRRNRSNTWEDAYGPAYATSMACIILQLPNNYLPIMQK